MPSGEKKYYKAIYFDLNNESFRETFLRKKSTKSLPKN